MTAATLPLANIKWINSLLHIDRGEGERGREGDTYPVSSLCSMNESISYNLEAKSLNEN